jgi:hypothetical protein
MPMAMVAHAVAETLQPLISQAVLSRGWQRQLAPLSEIAEDQSALANSLCQ